MIGFGFGAWLGATYLSAILTGRTSEFQTAVEALRAANAMTTAAQEARKAMADIADEVAEGANDRTEQ